jgi:glycosyltransferase involved in cell wall biosynthesis
MDALFVEVSSLLSPRLTGVGRYTAQLVRALNRRLPLRLFSLLDRGSARIARCHDDLVAGEEIAAQVGALSGTGPDDDLQTWARSACGRPKRRFDPAAARDRTALYTWMRPPAPMFRREFGVWYDFTPLVLPQTHRPEMCAQFRRHVRDSAHFAGAVAISESTKSDAAWLSPMDNRRIHVAYPGPSQCIARHASADVVEREDNLALVVSTREPRKNGEFLLRWFLDSPVLPDATRLVWVGPPGWLRDVSRDAPARGARRVEFAGMVSDAALCRLYRRAAFTIYPSLYEGFGFPVLDSLRHGAPVLCSFNSSLQEFNCPGVFYFDACDPVTLDEAYLELQGNRPVRIDQADLDRRFTWDAAAETVVRLVRGDRDDGGRGEFRDRREGHMR